MIQRVQTLYLAIAIILLSIVTFGTTLFSFVFDTSRYAFSSYGIMKYGLEDGKLLDQQNFPFYIGTIALILLCFLCLMSYKNLDRQFKLGRLIFALYFIMLVSIFLLSMFGAALIDIEGTADKREMGLGFFLFVAGFPFTFLANTGIKRDKRLLDSLDRLR